MANFTWKNAAGGDWSVASNWTIPSGISPPRPPIRATDTASFDNLATSYTVTVAAGTTVGDSVNGGPFVEIDVTALVGAPALSISGTLIADFIYHTDAGDPATSVAIEAGGSLDVPTLLYSVDVPQILTISGAAGTAGGHLELGDLTVGGIVSGTSSLMILEFANTSVTALNTGVIQFDSATLPGAVATQTITDVGRGDKFVVAGADFTDDTVALDTTTHVLTVKDVSNTTVFTMDDVSLQAGATNSFVASGDVIEAVCFFAGTMIACPDGQRAVETLAIGDLVLTSDDRVVPVRWIGHNIVSTRFADPLRVLPIRIHAGALGANCPVRDLLVSPSHGILIDGVLVHASALVNGVSVTREHNVPAVFIYYHVELDMHSLLLAEGAPAESFLDGVELMPFVNWADRVGPAAVEEMPYPRVKSARQLPPSISEQLGLGACGPYKMALNAADWAA